MSRLSALAAVCALAAVVSPTRGGEPTPKPDYSRGEKQLTAYFRSQVQDISSRCLTDLTTKEDWEKRRPELRRQFLDMMGLWPLPERTDLKATITGRIEAERFTVEKLHFQSMPGLYVTANLYLPKPVAGGKERAPEQLPTILYVCGHGRVVVDGVAMGNKTHYHYHPAWFAENGYVCLIIDTLQLGEIEGLHHGTYRDGMWWWHSRGYTPAGVELWNAMRALDYLETRPEVDPKRIGVTGRSGGGAYSWWIAAADDRIAAAVPVAGIADLHAHVCEGAAERLRTGVIAGHCDCMYFVNTYRWDFAMVAALIAPRPLLLGNSDADDIFPVAGYRRLAHKVRKVYALYGADEKFQLLETKGPHSDTPELHVGINQWMNRWLKDKPKSLIIDDLAKPFKPAQLKVFDKLPEPRLNETIQERFVPVARFEVPAEPAAAAKWWAAQKPKLMTALREQVFAGWAKDPPPLKPVVAVDVTHDGVRLRAIDFVSEAAVELRMWVLSSPKVETPREVILTVLDEAGWNRWCADLGPDFAGPLQSTPTLKRDDAKFAQNRAAMESNAWAFAAIAPRGIGPTRWAEPGSKDDTQIRRRFPLLGQTLDGQRVWDVRRSVAVMQSVDDLRKAPLTLQGTGEAAGIGVYAAIFEPTVTRLDLWHLPASHRSGPALLNVMRHLDTPQAVALVGPRKVTLHVRSREEQGVWNWLPGGNDGLTVKVVGE